MDSKITINEKEYSLENLTEYQAVILKEFYTVTNKINEIMVIREYLLNKLSSILEVIEE